jgi:LysR family tcuABC transcriptional regulator
MKAMRERYPDVRLHLVEALSGNLAADLNARRLDLAVVFDVETQHRWSVMPLLEERLFVIGRADLPGMPNRDEVALADLGTLPLILPTASHGLRTLVNAALARARCEPSMIAEIDGLALLMDAVRSGLGATLQPGAALARELDASLRRVRVRDPDAHRRSLLVSVSDEELSPAGLAARVVLADVARRMVREGRWAGATLHED